MTVVPLMRIEKEYRTRGVTKKKNQKKTKKAPKNQPLSDEPCSHPQNVDKKPSRMSHVAMYVVSKPRSFAVAIAVASSPLAVAIALYFFRCFFIIVCTGTLCVVCMHVHRFST